jgi:Cytochrome C oxidase, cbb3-type, subunit III
MKCRLQLRWFALMAGLTTLSLVAACRRDMQVQPKYVSLSPSAFFADNRSARPIPAHTISRGHLNDNDAFHTGAMNGVFLDTIPMPITRQLLDRGQQRFDIFCTPCHGPLGDGDGMVARRGFKVPANFHTDRLRHAPPGYLFQVISNGYGAMPDYVNQIHVADRWAIIAYIRALQLSQDAAVADVPAQDRKKLGLP